MSNPYYIDKTACWWGIDPKTGFVHCYLHSHRLCDSAPGDNIESVIDQADRPACGKCIERLNTAIHDTRGTRAGHANH